MVTKVEEIRSYLIASIQNGKLAPGDRLPSIRQLANQFSCNKDTVQRVLIIISMQSLGQAITSLILIKRKLKKGLVYQTLRLQI